MASELWTVVAVRDDLTAMVEGMGRDTFRYYPNRNGTCDYVRGNGGEGEGHGCIVGEWLRRNSANMTMVDEWQAGAWAGNADLTPDVHGMYGTQGPPEAANLPTLTRGAVEWLAVVQRQQDSGATWGQAIHYANAARGVMPE